MGKKLKGFRFNPEVYKGFKECASMSGYTVTAALERFMTICLECGNVAFPESTRIEDLEAETRIMLTWLKKKQYWYCLGSSEREISVKGRLLQLLYKIHDSDLKKEIEEELKKH